MGAIYGYVDEHGVYHFANTRPPAGKGYHIIITGSESRRASVTDPTTILRNSTYDRLIRHHSEINGLDYRLVKAVMMAESRGTRPPFPIRARAG